MTALFCDEYNLGAKVLMELTDSISDPPDDVAFTVIDDTSPSNIASLFDSIVPVNVNVDAPLPFSPFEMI